MIDLHVEGKAEALRVVQKLHRNLGHPSTKSLVELLQSRNASEAVIQLQDPMFALLANDTANQISLHLQTSLMSSASTRRFNPTSFGSKMSR